MSAPLRVAFLSFDTNMFGSERSMLDVIRGLDRAKVAPVVATVSEGPLATAVRAQGLELEIFPWFAGPFSESYRKIVPAALKLAAWLRRREIRIVELNRLSFGHLAVVNLAAAIAGCATIARVRMPSATITSRQKFSLLCSSAVVPVSLSTISAWKSGWWPSSLERLIRVLPDGRDVAGLKRLPRDRAVLRALGVPDAAPVVGMVGAIVANKRPDLFLRAAERIAAERPDAWFVVVGGPLDDSTPEYEAGLHRFLAGKPFAARTVFTGYRTDALTLMKNFSVMVMPSDREAFGGVLIEAMALGVPLVAHGVDGTPEILDHGRHGVLIPEQDERLYAGAVLRLLGDSAAAEALVRAGLEGAGRFESATIARRTEALYAELAGGKA